MPAKTLKIEVQNVLHARLTPIGKPILAIAELVWNAVDADAKWIDVSLTGDYMGGLEAIKVSDDGHGPTYSDAVEMFSRFGDSWNRGGGKPRRENRFPCGRRGGGRFRAFGLGSTVNWDVTYKSAEGMRRYRISMRKDALDQVEVSEETEAPADSSPGVLVSIGEVERNLESLRSDGAAWEMTQIIAPYLRKYPDIHVNFNECLIDSSAVIDHAAVFMLPEIDEAGSTIESSIDIVEWNKKADRRLFLCDETGFPLHGVSLGFQDPGVNFTSYLKSEYFNKLSLDNLLDVSDLNDAAVEIMEAAIGVLRDYFREKPSEREMNPIARWRDENIYPYWDPPINEALKISQQVFDVVALKVHRLLPAFEKADGKIKKFQLHLLRHAIEHAPDDLSKIITELFDPPEKIRRELEILIDRTTLSNMISASKVIAGRLELIKEIETLVLGANCKDRIPDRSRLHRILAENAWIFGEQYHLSVDDQSLTEVLKAHVSESNPEIAIDEPVNRPDGSRGVVDLMFSRNTQNAGSGYREHLIVELKRPNVIINSNMTSQVENYAFAAANDPRFREIRAKWVFWVVSEEMDAIAKLRASQQDRPNGLTYRGSNPDIDIWVKTWSQIINDCKARLQFFSEKLNYTPDRDASLSHLSKTYKKYFSELLPMDPGDSSPDGRNTDHP